MNREGIIRMAEEAECGVTLGNRAYFFEIDELEAFAKLVATAEREACADLIDTTDLSALNSDPQLQKWVAMLLQGYVNAIRARGEK